MPTIHVRPPVADVLGAVAVLGLALAEVLSTDDLPHRPVVLALVPLMALPLAVRRSRPMATLLLVSVGVFGGGILAPEADWVSTFAALVVSCYSVAAYTDGWSAAAGLAFPLSFFAIGTVTDNLRDPGSRPLGDLLYVTVMLSATWAVGRIVRRWRQQAAELSLRTRELEAEREWRARAAVAEERTRIARELHDVVAHSVSVMVVQAAAAEEVLTCGAELARQPLQRIQETGRQAVLELRCMLGILRPGEEDAVRAPQPTLEDLGRLIDDARAAGLEIDVHIGDEVRDLPPGVELTAYRIVQEALTNALKHAGPTSASVRVRCCGDDLHIEVVDQGARRSPGKGRRSDVLNGGANGGLVESGVGAGLGLVGMRERVTLYGGDLDTGPLERGGFAVRAVLPR